MHDAETRLGALMRASLAGDARAYRVLLSELAVLLRAYFTRRLPAGNAEAEDLVQETLLALHNRRATYDAARPFTAWFWAVARYKLIDHIRRNRLRPTVPLEEADDVALPESEAGEAQLDLDRLLATLPARTQALVRAVKIEGRPVAEVAQAADMTEVAARVAMHRGLRALMARLKERDS